MKRATLVDKHLHEVYTQDILQFPYEFPKPGHYRVWLQFKVDQRIRTAVFDVVVTTIGNGEGLL